MDVFGTLIIKVWVKALLADVNKSLYNHYTKCTSYMIQIKKNQLLHNKINLLKYTSSVWICWKIKNTPLVLLFYHLLYIYIIQFKKNIYNSTKEYKIEVILSTVCRNRIETVTSKLLLMMFNPYPANTKSD